MMNWRNRMGEERLQALLQESLSVATRTDATKLSDLACVVVDATVQPRTSPSRPTPSWCIGPRESWSSRQSGLALEFLEMHASSLCGYSFSGSSKPNSFNNSISSKDVRGFSFR
jgi:hypothetical protein